MSSIKNIALLCASLVFVVNTPVRAEDIIIAQVASATHPVPKENVKAAAIGFRAFFGKINESGGVLGRKVVLESQDDHFNPAETVSLVNSVIREKKALALFATVGTANLAELVKAGVLPQNDMALVAPVSGLPKLLAAPNVFPIRANYIDELRQIVKHSKTIYLRRPVFIHLDTPLAADLTAELTTGMAEDGRKLLASLPISPAPEAEKMKAVVRDAVAKALQSSPDMCVVFGPGSIAPAVVEALRAHAGPSVAIYLMSVSSADAVIKLSSLKNTNGVIISQALPLPTDTGNRSVRQYLADMKKYAPDAQISHLTLEGYLGARVLFEGMKRAGPNLTRSTLLASLNALGKYDLGDFEVDYNPGNKRGSRFVDMTLINKSGFLIH